ncbi:MAG: amidohydrolase family protein [Thermoguttaceae bacterium]
MTEQQRYETIDLPFYRSVLAPKLPPAILDFHTHVWRRDQWRDPRAKTAHSSAEASAGEPGGGYMATDVEYDADDLLRDARRMFPDRPYHAVCFGNPTPAGDTDATNAYAAEAGRREGLYPLRVTGRDLTPPDLLRQEIRGGHFFGFKVFLGWLGDNYGNIRVEEMIGPAEMGLANELELVVLLHVPRAERLADPDIQRGVAELARRYPRASIVLAHCGRCYLPAEMQRAIAPLHGLKNVYFDTAMVMDPAVLRMVFENLGPRRVLFATDLPVAAMRGRRVHVMDHWVDLVLEGYPSSAYRVGFDGMRATFMTYEIAWSVILAAESAGLSPAEAQCVFYQNGMDLLAKAGKDP